MLFSKKEKMWQTTGAQNPEADQLFTAQKQSQRQLSSQLYSLDGKRSQNRSVSRPDLQKRYLDNILKFS